MTMHPYIPNLHHRLLTPAEEQDLGHIIQRGITWPNPTARPAPDPILTPEALKARNALVTSNLRLARSVACKYGVGRMDLEARTNLAVMGLITAANKFDPCRGWRFSTGAVWWVRKAVVRGVVEQGYAIKLSEHTVIGAGKAKKQIAQGLTPDRLDLEKLRHASKFGKLISCDRPVGDGLYLLDTFAGNDGPVIDDDFVRDLVEKEISLLPEIERAFVRRVFYDGLRYIDAAEELGVHKDKARHLKDKAFRKLRKKPSIFEAWKQLAG